MKKTMTRSASNGATILLTSFYTKLKELEAGNRKLCEAALPHRHLTFNPNPKLSVIYFYSIVHIYYCTVCKFLLSSKTASIYFGITLRCWFSYISICSDDDDDDDYGNRPCSHGFTFREADRGWPDIVDSEFPSTGGSLSCKICQLSLFLGEEIHLYSPSFCSLTETAKHPY